VATANFLHRRCEPHPQGLQGSHLNLSQTIDTDQRIAPYEKTIFFSYKAVKALAAKQLAKAEETLNRLDGNAPNIATATATAATTAAAAATTAAAAATTAAATTAATTFTADGQPRLPPRRCRWEAQADGN
jgi:hypothetical protein